MAYRSLRLQSFRSYADYAVDLSGGVTIVAGPNGSGKTNLLEALYVLSTGSSFRTHDRELLQHGREWFRIDGAWGDQQRVLTYRRAGDVADKQFLIDGAKKARLTHQQRVPVVLFEPDHLRLLRASPTSRRDYLDSLLSKLQPDFIWLKHQFERALLQRNNVLKKRLPAYLRDDQLFAWDIKFADLAEQVVTRRQQVIAQLNARLDQVYSTIAHKTSSARITYQSTAPLTDYRAGLLRLLSESIDRDQQRGFTGIGPQRDDFSIVLNNEPASTTASRGEMRSLLLALKMIELNMLESRADQQPLLLLDDVFSELDTSRRRALAELAKAYQTIITTTDADATRQHFGHDYAQITTG